jgi:hypothetical protein
MSDRFAAPRPPAIRSLPARTHRFTIGAAAVIPALLIGLLGGTRSDAPHDSGLIACAYPLSTQDVPAADHARLRAQFAGSRWPDLRNAGTTYIDLATQLTHSAIHRRIPDRPVPPAADRRPREARTVNGSNCGPAA